MPGSNNPCSTPSPTASDRDLRVIVIGTFRHLPFMRKSLGAKTLLYPQVVYIIGTYNEDGTPNAMNAAWGGIMGEDRVAICVDRTHRTTANFKRTGSFTVSPQPWTPSWQPTMSA